ncbi:two-component regulator propeller domain-containing protein [uncultured Empedobacter sp.]|uniref:type IX secretion system anionic LPS delivery protein PorZ n=1 Tax=uncultured Empedobacter sp. TaxID=410844 RepID=UPI00260A1BD1|nr:two-component regulator propeller domain-containing protein [uncultured Empedobacter sp.]
MKTKLFIFITMIFTSLNAQNDKARWNDLFSYSNVKLLEEVNGVIYCGTENGIFLFNPKNPTNDWIKLNKTNFLNNVGVSAMAYDKESDSFLVGYENGGLDLLKSGESTMVLDIKWNGFNGVKKINHIFINDGIAFISGAFGIVSYDLKDEEFKETTRTNTAVVNDATILNNKLYIATSKGIFSSELTSKKLNNPNINLWTVQNLNQNVSNIELFEKEIYYSVENELKTISGTPVSEAFNFIEDLKLSNEKLIITQNNQISVLGSGDYSKSEINFNTAISIDNIVYGGSVNHGIINLSNLEEFYPDGPFNNKAWSVTTKNGKVWIAPGGTEGYTAPIQNEDGFSMYNGKKWNHFSSECLGTARDITTVSVNPTNDKNFVIGSFNKVDNNTRLFEFNTDFSTNLSNCRDEYKLILNTEIPGSRISGVKFDALGDLYIGASFPSNFSQDWKVTFYAKRTNNSWITYGPESGNESVALSPSVTDSYVYYPVARNGGIIVFDKNLGKVQSINTSNSKLPINNVLAIANDKTNNLWIGTGQGLVVLYSADDSVKNNTVNVEPIVIIQDGIPEALLTDVGIYSIKVDNANRKWIATNGAGVYYVSESGEETKLHFTSKNSPLPSDIVYDVSIDETTGKVFFATEKGVVSYNGDVSTETNNFNDAIAYPNPYRPEYTGNITIKNLPNRALVKITDIVGNLLFEKKADGGVIEWNTNNSKGKPVASGIYLVLMTNADGTETKTLKLAVVR